MLARSEIPFLIESIKDINERTQAESAKKTADYTLLLVIISLITMTFSILFARSTLIQK